MKNVDIEIPADAKTVTLALQDREQRALTLRTILPLISDEVELVVEDAFMVDKFGVSKDSDLYRLKAGDGGSMLRSLERSRVVEGEYLLDQVPRVKRADPTFSLFAGTFGVNTGTGCIQLWVRPPVPDEGD